MSKQEFAVEASITVPASDGRAADPAPGERSSAEDAESLRATLDAPDDHFVNDDGTAPLIVRHADGQPIYAVVGGELVPHEEWRNRES